MTNGDGTGSNKRYARNARVVYRTEPGYYNHSLNKYVFERTVSHVEYDDEPVKQSSRQPTHLPVKQTDHHVASNKSTSKPAAPSLSNGHAFPVHDQPRQPMANGHVLKG